MSAEAFVDPTSRAATIGCSFNEKIRAYGKSQSQFSLHYTFNNELSCSTPRWFFSAPQSGCEKLHPSEILH